MNEDTNTVKAMIDNKLFILIGLLSFVLKKNPAIKPAIVYDRAESPMNEPARISNNIPAKNPERHPMIFPFLIPI